jgi:putative transcriptional regulator
MDSDEYLRGRLAVATPALGDPNFAHTVVFLLDHSNEGALGIVLNRPSAVEVADTLPKWEALAVEPEVMFVGGPVQPEAVVGLVGAHEDSEAVQSVVPGVGIVDLRADPLSLIGEVSGLRLFAGYAGWGGGQLEAEVEEGGWFIVDAQPDDVFGHDPDELWVRVLTRQGGLFKTITEDPSLN